MEAKTAHDIAVKYPYFTEECEKNGVNFFTDLNHIATVNKAETQVEKLGMYNLKNVIQLLQILQAEGVDYVRLCQSCSIDTQIPEKALILRAPHKEYQLGIAPYIDDEEDEDDE